MDAVARQDIRNTVLVLAYCKQDHINTPYSKTDTRTALHIAAALGNLVLVQLLLWVCITVCPVDILTPILDVLQYWLLQYFANIFRKHVLSTCATKS